MVVSSPFVLLEEAEAARPCLHRLRLRYWDRQSLLREHETGTASRCRSLSDNQLRGGWGSRREHGRIDKFNDECRYDRYEKVQSRDMQISSGSMEEGGPDESLHAAYSGQRLYGSLPLPAHIPLPVLIHIPGAGLFGPFSPAPPEVARCMLREQDGPSSFEGKGGFRGRKLKSGLLVGGSASKLPIPQAFQLVSRCLRG